MQMDEKKPSVPKLRFPGFTDPWEQRKLGDLIEINSGRDYKHLENGGIPVYGTGGLLAYVNEALSYKKDAVGIGRKGTIDHPYKLKAPFWTVDTLFYAVPSSQADLDFVLGLFHRINWKSKDESTGLPSLSKKIINSVPIMAPLFQEQQKIGKALSYCDSLITLHRRKLEHLREMKRGLLQKMFPKDGESVPELRFPGFTDPWEQRKLSDYLDVSSNKNRDGAFSKEQVLSVSGELGIVNQIELKGRSFAGSSVRDYGVVKTGDIVYTKSPLRSNPFGIFKTNKGCPGIVSTLYAVYRPTARVIPDFVQDYFNLDYRVNKYLHPLVNKGAKNDMKVSAANALGGEVQFPGLEEQAAISRFFSQFDSLITLHQRKELASMVNCLQIGGGPINPNRTAP